MHYEINVSQHGQHVFATHERSLDCERQAMSLVSLLSQAFEEKHGYKITVTKWSKTGTEVKL